jgi:hypothetical protein
MFAKKSNQAKYTKRLYRESFARILIPFLVSLCIAVVVSYPRRVIFVPQIFLRLQREFFVFELEVGIMITTKSRYKQFFNCDEIVNFIGMFYPPVHMVMLPTF